jgi:hypothetical protein
VIAQVSAEGEFFLHLNAAEVDEAQRIWNGCLDEDGSLEGFAFLEALREHGNLPHLDVIPAVVCKALTEAAS